MVGSGVGSDDEEEEGNEEEEGEEEKDELLLSGARPVVRPPNHASQRASAWDAMARSTSRCAAERDVGSASVVCLASSVGS